MVSRRGVTAGLLVGSVSLAVPAAGAVLYQASKGEGEGHQVALEHLGSALSSVNSAGFIRDSSGQPDLYTTVALARLFLTSSAARRGYPDQSQVVINAVREQAIDSGLPTRRVTDTILNLEMAHRLGQDIEPLLAHLQAMVVDQLRRERAGLPSQPTKEDGLAWRVYALEVLHLVGAHRIFPNLYAQIRASVEELLDPKTGGIKEHLTGTPDQQRPVNDLTLVAFRLGVGNSWTRPFLTNGGNTHGYFYHSQTLTDTLALFVQVFPKDTARRDALMMRTFAEDRGYDEPRSEILFHINLAQGLLSS